MDAIGVEMRKKARLLRLALRNCFGENFSVKISREVWDHGYDTSDIWNVSAVGRTPGMRQDEAWIGSGKTIAEAARSMWRRMCETETLTGG